MVYSNIVTIFSVLLVQLAANPPQPHIAVKAIYVGPHYGAMLQSTPEHTPNGYRGHDYSLEISITMPGGVQFRPSLYRAVCLSGSSGTFAQNFDSTTVQMTSDTTWSYAMPYFAEQEKGIEVFLLWRADLHNFSREDFLNWPKLDAPFMRTSNRVQLHLSPAEASKTK